MNFQVINILQSNSDFQLKPHQFKLKILLMVRWIEKEKAIMVQKQENVYYLLMILTCHLNKNMVHNPQSNLSDNI